MTSNLTRAISSTILCFALAFAITPSALATGLDQAKVQKLYNDGEFEGVISTVENYMKQVPVHSRADSVFIAKHLAVVYAANPATREKGRYYMYRLLELVPSAQLIDMYVSDEIDRIFERTRREYESRLKAMGKDPEVLYQTGATDTVVTAGSNEPATPARPTPSKWKRTWPYWVGGGVVLVGTGAVVMLLSDSDAPPQVQVLE